MDDSSCILNLGALLILVLLSYLLLSPAYLFPADCHGIFSQLDGPEVLHTPGNNKHAYKALIAAEYSDVKIELVKNFEMGVSNQTLDFLKMNPLGKIPVLETPDGLVFESNTIARYVTRTKPDNPLPGSSLIEYAQIEQWIDFASFEIHTDLGLWLSPRMGHVIYIAQAEELAISSLKRALGALNTHLATTSFLVGDSVRLADIVTVCYLYYGFAAKDLQLKKYGQHRSSTILATWYHLDEGSIVSVPVQVSNVMVDF